MRVTYAITIVTSRTDSPAAAAESHAIPRSSSHASIGFARVTAAAAEASMPTKVIPTWIVASRRVGSSVSDRAAFAPEEPPSARFLRAALRALMSAISAAAKYPLSATSTMMKTISKAALRMLNRLPVSDREKRNEPARYGSCIQGVNHCQSSPDTAREECRGASVRYVERDAECSSLQA